MLIAIILIAILTYMEALFIGSAALAVAFVLIAALIGIIAGIYLVWKTLFENAPKEEYDEIQKLVLAKKLKKKK